MLPPGVFDPSTMTNEELGQFEFIVNSLSYQRVFKAYAAKMIRSYERLMRDPSQARKDQYPNDYLAGGADALEGFITFLDGLLRETNMDRMVKTQLATAPEEYQRLRDLGLIKHSGQSVPANEVQEAIDQALAEDY